MKTDLLYVERRALAEVWRRKKLLAAQLVGNALLAGLAYGWLWIPEETVAEVVLSAVLALVVVFGALWLHSTALAAFHVVVGPLRVGMVLRRLPRFVPWVALMAAVIAVAVWLAGYTAEVTAYLASLFTLRLRTAVSPQQVDWVYPALLRGACAVVLLVLLPLASQAAGAGFSWRRALRVVARPRYWVACAVLVLAGLYAPARLIGWIPSFESLLVQAASVVLRFGAAYALAVTAWLTLAAIVAGFGRRG